MPCVGLDSEPLMRVPQPHSLVAATCEAVVAAPYNNDGGALELGIQHSMSHVGSIISPCILHSQLTVEAYCSYGSLVIRKFKR